jgi:hypothetical protein
MSGQYITYSTGTIPVINQIDGSQLCVIKQPENNKCPKTYITGKAIGSNYIECFEVSNYSPSGSRSPSGILRSPSGSPSGILRSPSGSPSGILRSPSVSPSASNSKCKNYIQVSTPNSDYNPPMGEFLSQSTINYCKKSLCRDDKNKIVLVSDNNLSSFICP